MSVWMQSGVGARPGGSLMPAEPNLAERPSTKKPPMYKVILLNDDYTPMEFVVEVLLVIFHKNKPEAMRIMLNVHNKGSGICGVYTLEVAEMRMNAVVRLAEQHSYPLHCVVEKA